MSCCARQGTTPENAIITSSCGARIHQETLPRLASGTSMPSPHAVLVRDFRGGRSAGERRGVSPVAAGRSDQLVSWFWSAGTNIES